MPRVDSPEEAASIASIITHEPPHAGTAPVRIRRAIQPARRFDPWWMATAGICVAVAVIILVIGTPEAPTAPTGQETNLRQATVDSQRVEVSDTPVHPPRRSRRTPRHDRQSARTTRKAPSVSSQPEAVAPVARQSLPADSPGPDAFQQAPAAAEITPLF